jgi:hypothetical protein
MSCTPICLAPCCVVALSCDAELCHPYCCRREQRQELRSLCKETRLRERAVVSDVLRRSNVVLSTCVGAGSKLLQREEFDLVVIDEAAQGLEAACWIPILKMKEAGGRCVLAGTTIADDTALHSIIQVVNPWGSPSGDHCQLPPTIKSAQAEKGGLSVTLFERIIKDARFSNVVCLLDTQYRMNRRISDWASHNMYHDAIQSHPSVAEHTLRDILPGGRATLSTSVTATDAGTDSTETGMKGSTVPTAADETGPLVSDQQETAEEQYPVLLLIDTSGLGMFEDSSLENNTGGDTGGKKLGASHRNFHEAELVKQHVLSLVRSGAQTETSRRNYLSHSVIPFLQSFETFTVLFRYTHNCCWNNPLGVYRCEAVADWRDHALQRPAGGPARADVPFYRHQTGRGTGK